MNACKIQGLNSYFAKFKDKFGRFFKIQGRIWGISPSVFVQVVELDWENKQEK